MYRMTSPESVHTIEDNFPGRVPIRTSQELEAYLKQRIAQAANGRAALALSGGIDSAVLAKFMPKGSIAYTFKCVVPGAEVTDETPAAARYAKECGLEHRVIEVYWEDFEKYAPLLMKHKGAPIHSIEVQIYKAALRAKADGIENIIFGEAADAVYGGHSSILSKDYTVGEFIQRYTYLMPYMALKNSEIPAEMISRYQSNGYVDPFEFMSNVYIQESVASYLDPSAAAGIKVTVPYAETFLADKIDYARIRSGENKYLVREVFNRLYPDFEVPPKTPMPRPMNEWLKDWKGPQRKEFWENCVHGLTGDRKWLLWALETYLDMSEAQR